MNRISDKNRDAAKWPYFDKLSRIHAAEECPSLPQDKLARDDDSSTGDDYIIIMEIIRINEING